MLGCWGWSEGDMSCCCVEKMELLVWEIILMEELCMKVVEVGRVCDRIVLVFDEDLLKMICGYAPQSGRSLEQ